MSVKNWTVVLDGRPHEVVLRHGFWSARRQIQVDGQLVVDVRPRFPKALQLWNTPTDHQFAIAGHPASIRIDPTVDNMTYKKALVVDGRDVDSGESMTLLPAETSIGREGPWLGSRPLVAALSFVAILLGYVAFQMDRGAIWIVAGLVGGLICDRSGKIVGPSTGRQLAICIAVVAFLFIAPRL